MRGVKSTATAKEWSMGMRKREWAFGAGSGVVVAAILGVVLYGATSGDPGSDGGVSVVPAAPAGGPSSGDGDATHSGDFSVTSVPDEFHSATRTQAGPDTHDASGTNRSAKRIERVDGEIRRTMNFTTVDSDNRSDSQDKAFTVSTVTGVSIADLQARKDQYKRDTWTTVNGHKWLLEPANSEHALNAVMWNVGEVGISVVGRGMTMAEVVNVAKEVRLS